MSSIAEQLAKKQKEISVSEFFERNRQILGFDSQTKSLIMGVKEAVDNSLDACEEASILPEVIVAIERVDQNEFKVTVEDNGPGIVPRVVPNVFGRLLYGSRFHSLRQSRGQQGIGISATVMYGQITTGKPATIISKTENEDAAVKMDIMVNTKKNAPEILRRDFIIWDGKPHGTKIEFYMNGRYVAGKQSVLEYLKETAIVNPHAMISFTDPEGKRFVFARATENLPQVTKEIKPHHEGIELGVLMNMSKLTTANRLSKFLKSDFNRISDRVAKEICEKAWLTEDVKPQDLTLEQFKQLLAAMSSVKIMAPPTDCLSPIGEGLIRKGLKNVLDELRPEFYAPPVTREPKVYQGCPFLVEAGVVYGGDLPKDQPVTILRFANRVPLLYQQGACAITKAVERTDWRRYGLDQRGGEGVPFGPAIILVHVASTKIPFTSEAKEAVANIPEMIEEIELALKACGRKLKTHLNKKDTKVKTRAKFEIVQEIIPMIAEKSAKIVRKEVPPLNGTITKIMNVVWVDDAISYDKGRHRVKIRVFNYTPKSQTFNLHLVVPQGSLDEGSASPKPAEVKDDQKLCWEIKRLASTDMRELSFELVGLDQEAYEENELYCSNINPISIIGADPLPGDWDVDKLAVTEVEAPEAAQETEEEEEVDYDEQVEALNDEQ